MDSDSGEEQRLMHAYDVYDEAIAWEEQGDSRCVDRFFEVAAATWSLRTQDVTLDDEAQIGACDLHDSALMKLLTTAQEFGRWHQITGLSIQSSQGTVQVPVQYRGFVWRPEDFDAMMPVGPYRSTTLSRRYGNDGVGVPLVVVRQRPPGQPFVRQQTAFAATAVLKPAVLEPADGMPLDEMLVPTTVVSPRSPMTPT